ncbi:MAG: hypothetical protein P4L79_10550 [Legionella sp.]|uniref:hypothetical protein n=1 Tax=Legionella sp. TaxID=459 RepID=UPI00283EDF07|nr:hypothetical protein [Legionella sp.]
MSVKVTIEIENEKQDVVNEIMKLVRATDVCQEMLYITEQNKHIITTMFVEDLEEIK